MYQGRGSSKSEWCFNNTMLCMPIAAESVFRLNFHHSCVRRGNVTSKGHLHFTQAQNEGRLRLINRDICLLLCCYHLLSAKSRNYHNNILKVTLRPGKTCINSMLMLALRELLELLSKKRINQKNNTYIYPRKQWNATLSIWLFS